MHADSNAVHRRIDIAISILLLQQSNSQFQSTRQVIVLGSWWQHIDKPDIMQTGLLPGEVARIMSAQNMHIIAASISRIDVLFHAAEASPGMQMHA